MSGLTDIFTGGAKVVISPDEMRAWIMLPAPAPGVKYTAEAVAAWLPEQGVVFGADPKMIQAAVNIRKYDELLEVARGTAPTPASGGGYELRVEKRPFTGLSGNPDGSLHYEDLGFLQEVQEGQILAEVFPPTPGRPGRTVTGAEVPAKEADDAKALAGSGFVVTDEGRYYRAPCLAHVNIVNDQLVVTPLLKLQEIAEGAAPVEFDGNLLVEENILAGAQVQVTGSIFVKGKTFTSTLQAGRNVLLCEGMRSQMGIGRIEAKENVWGLCFESADITAGGDLCANHLLGCEARVQGRALVLGGRGQISNSNVYAKNGVVAAVLGDKAGQATTITAGMDAGLIDRADAVDKRIAKLNNDLQALQQNIQAFERINRTKPDKGQADPGYVDMVKKRDTNLRTLNILTAERTRLKRSMEAFSAVSVIARDSAWPGLVVVIDTRRMQVDRQMQRCKFKRDQDVIQVVAVQQR